MRHGVLRTWLTSPLDIRIASEDTPAAARTVQQEAVHGSSKLFQSFKRCRFFEFDRLDIALPGSLDSLPQCLNFTSVDVVTIHPTLATKVVCNRKRFSTRTRAGVHHRERCDGAEYGF